MYLSCGWGQRNTVALSGLLLWVKGRKCCHAVRRCPLWIHCLHCVLNLLPSQSQWMHTCFSIAIYVNMVMQKSFVLYCKLLWFECQTAKLLLNCFIGVFALCHNTIPVFLVFVFSWLQTISFFISHFTFKLGIWFISCFTGTNSICQWSANRYQTSWALSAISTI